MTRTRPSGARTAGLAAAWLAACADWHAGPRRGFEADDPQTVPAPALSVPAISVPPDIVVDPADDPYFGPCPLGFTRSATVPIDRARPCLLKPGLPLLDDPQYTLVSLDGARLRFGAKGERDYRWIGEALLIEGAACERLTASAAEAHQVSIFYGSCPERAPKPRCDDGGAIVDPLVLGLVTEGSDPCRWRLSSVPDPFELARLELRLDGLQLMRDTDDGYRVDADVVELTGAACTRVLASEQSPHLLQVRYGACRE